MPPAPPDLRPLLARPGLAPAERCLVALTAAVGPADWARFDTAVTLARDVAGCPREHVAETLLQCTLFFGFPRTVTAFGRFAELWPATAADTVGTPVPVGERRAAGESLFAAIYGTNTDSVRAMLAGCHPEFHDFVLEAAYGRILARPDLTPRVRELGAVAALAVLEQRPQLVAHARGAVHFGADRDALHECLLTVLGDRAKEIEALLDRILRRGDG